MTRGLTGLKIGRRKEWFAACVIKLHRSPYWGRWVADFPGKKNHFAMQYRPLKSDTDYLEKSWHLNPSRGGFSSALTGSFWSVPVPPTSWQANPAWTQCPNKRTTLDVSCYGSALQMPQPGQHRGWPGNTKCEEVSLEEKGTFQELVRERSR